jgi:oligopeptide transport system substrate-binding protein
VLIKKRHDTDFQIARHGWNADYNDATTFLSQIRCDSDSNDNKNCNRKAEALIIEGDNLTDPVKRATLMTQAAKMIMDDYPMIPLLQYTIPRMLKTWVGGYDEANPMDRYRSKDFYIIKH